MQGDKNIIKFDGDHNSSRPQFYYDSVLIFFYNVLRPPQVPSACSSKLESYSAAGLDEVICTPLDQLIQISCLFICLHFYGLVSSTVSMVKHSAQESNCLVLFLLYCQNFLYEIISGLRSACIDVASSSSSSAPPASLTTKPTNELLSEAMPIMNTVYLHLFT